MNPFLEVSDKLDAVARGFQSVEEDDDTEGSSAAAFTSAQWDAYVYGESSGLPHEKVLGWFIVC